MDALPDEIKTMMIGVRGIAVPLERLRKLRPEKVDQLVDSIPVRGLLQPIVVRPVAGFGNGYTLIAGWHRLEAVRRLEHEAIRAEVIKGLEMPIRSS